MWVRCKETRHTAVPGTSSNTWGSRNRHSCWGRQRGGCQKPEREGAREGKTCVERAEGCWIREEIRSKISASYLPRCQGASNEKPNCTHLFPLISCQCPHWPNPTRSQRPRLLTEPVHEVWLPAHRAGWTESGEPGVVRHRKPHWISLWQQDGSLSLPVEDMVKEMVPCSLLSWNVHRSLNIMY